MGFSRPAFRAAVAAASVSALALSGLALSAPASADPANPTPVSGTALPTAQVNGVVWTQTVANGVDYVGGSFNQSQPAGAAAGVDLAARSNLFAYDVATGGALAGFNATTNAQVRGVAASPDGTRIYIAGDFTVVNGQARHHIAALDPNGNLLPGFAPDVNGYVYSVVARGSGVACRRCGHVRSRDGFRARRERRRRPGCRDVT
jgi:DNA-binding beta-propeller fold protein YncE